MLRIRQMYQILNKAINLLCQKSADYTVERCKMKTFLSKKDFGRKLFFIIFFYLCSEIHNFLKIILQFTTQAHFFYFITQKILLYILIYILIENCKKKILLKKQKIKMHFSSRVQADKILNGPMGDAGCPRGSPFQKS